MKINDDSLFHETEHLKIYEFSDNGINYRIAITKKKAHKRIRISADDGQILWEEAFPAGRYAVFEKNVLIKPSELIEKNKVSILVIAGKPGIICGLDDGMIASANAFKSNFCSDKLYVMSGAAFKKI